MDRGHSRKTSWYIHLPAAMVLHTIVPNGDGLIGVELCYDLVEPRTSLVPSAHTFEVGDLLLVLQNNVILSRRMVCPQFPQGGLGVGGDWWGGGLASCLHREFGQPHLPKTFLLSEFHYQNVGPAGGDFLPTRAKELVT